MKLAFLPHNFPPEKGGISTWMYSICKSLPTNEVFVLTNEFKNSDEFDQKHTFHILRQKKNINLSLVTFFKTLYGIFKKSRGGKKANSMSYYWIFNSLRHLNYVQFNYLINTLGTWYDFIDGHKIDIIYCGFALPEGVAALLLKYFEGIPYGIFIHGLDIQSSKTSKSENELVRLILENADIVIANSQFTRDIAIAEFKNIKKKVRILNPGVDEALLNEKPDSRELRRKLKLNKQKVILTVANLVERKGHDMVIKALPEVIKQVPNVKYLIIGQGKYRDNLELLIAKLKLREYINFLGSVADSDLSLYYELCDVFIMPSRASGVHVEGFGISYVEAGAFGKPVIGGRSGGTADAIIDGCTGLLVNPRDNNEITEALIKLLTKGKLARELGENGKRRIKNELTWFKGALKFKELTENLLK